MDTIEKALQKHQQQHPGQEADSQPEPVDQPAPVEPLSANTVSEAELAEHQAPLNTLSEVPAAPSQFGKGPKLDIDLESLESKGFIVPNDKRSRLREEYKHIKRPLLQRIQRPRGGEFLDNIIMVTSAFSGEGKTYNALNLALSIGVERDCKVLLVDADVVKPSLGEIFDLKETPGLVDYLTGDIGDLSEVIMSTDIPNLRFISAGKKHHLTHELLASNAMVELANELASRYPDRVIILDSPPMLITSEAKVLTQLAGQVVLVIEQDKTSQSAVEDMVSSIDRDRLAGVVLNKSNAVRGSYYGYYYGD